jgi:hypothetical protein
MEYCVIENYFAQPTYQKLPAQTNIGSIISEPLLKLSANPTLVRIPCTDIGWKYCMGTVSLLLYSIHPE